MNQSRLVTLIGVVLAAPVAAWLVAHATVLHVSLAALSVIGSLLAAFGKSLLDDASVGPPASSTGPTSPPKPPPPPASDARKLWLVALALLLSGCAAVQSPKGQGVLTTLVDVTVCILNHDTESVEQIVVDCGPNATTDVITKVLDAEAAAMARARARTQSSSYLELYRQGSALPPCIERMIEREAEARAIIEALRSP